MSGVAEAADGSTTTSGDEQQVILDCMHDLGKIY